MSGPIEERAYFSARLKQTLELDGSPVAVGEPT